MNRDAFLPVLVEIIRAADPALRARLAKSIDEPWGSGDEFALSVAKKLREPHPRREGSLFEMLAQISDACR